jgi:hypothetical protein
VPPATQIESNNIQIVRSILDNLTKVRTQKKGWIDSEQETVERETLAFKIGESLRCFLIAQSLAPESFPELPLAKDILHSDIKRVFTDVNNDGFFPSPYSPIPGVNDQYTDFAAFCLEFSDLVYEYAVNSKQRQLQTLAKNIAKKALNFLTNPKHYRIDEEGCRWAGTSMYERIKKKKLVEYFTDVYFTSIVILALRKTLEHPVLALTERQKEKIRNLIRNSGKWLVSRSESGILTGDEKRNIKKLIYSTWGVRALVETYDTQDEVVRRSILPIAGAYLKAIDEKIEQDAVSVGQEYLYILSPSVDEPLHYEDRSDWGGIFLTLISLRTLPDAEDLLEKLNYKHILDAVYNGILLLRDPTSTLWYRDYFILSIHSYLTEGFILYDKHAKDFGVELSITSWMLRKALKETLADDFVFTTLHQVVYRQLLKSIQQTKQNRAIEKGLENFNEPSE